MKKAKKILVMVAALALTAAIAVGGTLAYLTAKTSVVTNTFTVGNVAITLDEAPVDVYGDVVAGDRTTANSYKLIPGHSYTKDPTVHVAVGSEQCWLFVKVENGLVKTIEGKEVNIEAVHSEEAEHKYDTIAEQMTKNGWVALTDEEGVYAYNGIVDARTAAVDKIVFGEFAIGGEADVSAYAQQTITVQAYAVQADGFDTYDEAWDSAPLTDWQ